MSDATIATLNDLIETCKDGEYGFRACAEQASSATLKQLFERRSQECRAAAAQLQAHVRELGGTPEDRGTALGAVHRGWVAVKTSLVTYDDRAVLDECERGEDAAMESYEEALEQNLPARIYNLVELQYQGVKQNHAEIRRLRDEFKAA
jgi:uncharacterized protein (TIGR02284 family)